MIRRPRRQQLIIGDRTSGETHGQCWQGVVTQYGVERSFKSYALVKLDDPIRSHDGQWVNTIAVPITTTGRPR